MLKVSNHGGSKVLVIGCHFVGSTCVHRGRRCRHVWGPFRGSPRCPTSLRFAKKDQLLEPPLPDEKGRTGNHTDCAKISFRLTTFPIIPSLIETSNLESTSSLLS